MKYWLTFYVEDVPGGFAGYAYGPIILLQKSYKNSFFGPSLEEHEKTHVRQWYRTLGLHGILYKLSRSYRLKSEVEAYKQQLHRLYIDYIIDGKFAQAGRVAAMNSHVDFYAEFLSTRYNLGITREQAKELLSQST